MHNSLVSDPNDGGLKDSRDEDNDTIISDSNLRSLLPPQLSQISERYKKVVPAPNVSLITFSNN